MLQFLWHSGHAWASLHSLHSERVEFLDHKAEGQILDFDKFARGHTTWFESSGSQPAAPGHNFLMPIINLDTIDEKYFIWLETWLLLKTFRCNRDEDYLHLFSRDLY